MNFTHLLLIVDVFEPRNQEMRKISLIQIQLLLEFHDPGLILRQLLNFALVASDQVLFKLANALKMLSLLQDKQYATVSFLRSRSIEAVLCAIVDQACVPAWVD